MCYYFHNVPGRLRVKTPLVKENRKCIKEVETLLGGIKGINSTTINPFTGSIVISYDAQMVNCEEILDNLEKNGYFDLSKAVMNNYSLSLPATTSKAGNLLKKLLVGMFVQKALEDSALAYLSILL
jgi:copper chaperone CopZ